MKTKTWEILISSGKDIIDILLSNRGLKGDKERKEFFDPTEPKEIWT